MPPFAKAIVYIDSGKQRETSIPSSDCALAYWTNAIEMIVFIELNNLGV
jgi:hypothetical protein